MQAHEQELHLPTTIKLNQLATLLYDFFDKEINFLITIFPCTSLRSLDVLTGLVWELFEIMFCLVFNRDSAASLIFENNNKYLEIFGRNIKKQSEREFTQISS